MPMPLLWRDVRFTVIRGRLVRAVCNLTMWYWRNCVVYKEPEAKERIHVLRIQTDSLTIAMVTKPTILPAEAFEVDALRKYPGATLKPTRTFSLVVFAYLEDWAEEDGLTIEELIDRREARQAL